MEDIRIAPEAPDGGWGWVAVVATFTVGTILAGYLKGIGVLLVEWQLYYDVGAKDVSWIGVAISLLTATSGPLATSLTTRYGSRSVVVCGGVVMATSLFVASFTNALWHLYIASVFSGLGISLSFFPALTAIGFYFEKKVGFANGIAFSGSGLGLIIIPPFLQFLLDSLDWRRTLRIFAGCALITCLCGLVMIPTKRQKYWMRKETKKRKKSLKQNSELLQPSMRQNESFVSGNVENSENSPKLRKLVYSCLKFSGFHVIFENKQYRIILMVSIWTSIGSYASLVYFNARAVFDVGLSQLQASYLVSAIGIGNLIARSSHGILLDRKWITPALMYALTSFVSAVVIALYPFSRCFVSLLVCAFVFGIANGPYPSLQVMLLRDMLLPGEVSRGYGVVVFFNGFAMVVGLFAMGYLFDTTGNYNLSFYVAGATLFISGIFACFIVHHQNQQTVESDLENDSCNHRKAHMDADRTCTLEMVQNKEWLAQENVEPTNDTADSSDECSNRIEGSRVKVDLQYEELI